MSDNTNQPLLLRENAVLERTGLSRSTARRLIQRGLFPAPVHPRGARVALWDASAVNAWIIETLNGAERARS